MIDGIKIHTDPEPAAAGGGTPMTHEGPEDPRNEQSWQTEGWGPAIAPRPARRRGRGGRGGYGDHGGHGGDGGWNGGQPGGRDDATPAIGDFDPAQPPSEILQRYGARTLDPASAVQFPGEDLRSTSYIADTLLVPLSLLEDEELRRTAGEEAAKLGCRLRPSET